MSGHEYRVPALGTTAPADTTASAGGAACAFVQAVVRQVAHPLRADPVAPPGGMAREAHVRERVQAAVDAALAGPGSAPFTTMAGVLAGTPTLLSALFQNLDLLPEGDVAASGMALLITAALDS